MADVRCQRRRTFCGQALHFRNYAPEPIEYALKRYAYEAKRHYRRPRRPVGQARYMLGDTYTIVDMAAWGWARLTPIVLGEAAWAKFPNLERLVDEISCAAGGATRGGVAGDKFKFKTEMDDLARRSLYRHQSEKVI